MKLYRSLHQIPYDDLTADSLLEHLYLCFRDPECLREMANVSKRNFDLPCNLWLDCGKSYLKSGHYKRIKFQKDHSNKIDKSNFAEMKLNGEIVEVTNKGTRLSSKEEDEVRNFVLNNRQCLSLLSDEKIFLYDFCNLAIKGGEPATELEKDNQREELDKLLKLYF